MEQKQAENYDQENKDGSQVEGGTKLKGDHANKKGADKYHSTSRFIEHELIETLAYLDTQIDLVDTQTIDVQKFSKSIFEAKKLLIEQRIATLRQLQTINNEQFKVSEHGGDEITNVTDLFDR